MSPDPARSDATPDRPASPAETPRSGGGDEEELPLPTGTLFFMMLYIMVMAGMWGAIYFEFLGR